MKRIDFTKSGGFPLEQDTLGFMQESYHEGIASLMGHLGVQGDKNYILSGVENNARGHYSQGWVIISGELLRFEAGEGTGKIEVVENTESALFKTGQTHPVYLEKFARFTQGNGLKIEEFTRIKKPGELQQDIQNLGDKVATDLMPFKNKLSTIEEGAQKNVQPDWNEANPAHHRFIRNKPKILTPQEVISDRVAFLLNVTFFFFDEQQGEVTELKDIDFSENKNIRRVEYRSNDAYSLGAVVTRSEPR